MFFLTWILFGVFLVFFISAMYVICIFMICICISVMYMIILCA